MTGVLLNVSAESSCGAIGRASGPRKERGERGRRSERTPAPSLGYHSIFGVANEESFSGHDGENRHWAVQPQRDSDLPDNTNDLELETFCRGGTNELAEVHEVDDERLVPLTVLLHLSSQL